MPELPEVETVRRTLTKRIVGEVIADVDVRFPGCIEGNDVEFFREKVRGRKVVDVLRRAKYLLIQLDDGASIVVHLRMTGRLTASERAAGENDIHLRVDFAFSSGRHMHFHDQRKFGRIGWYENEAEVGARIKVGPDPTHEDFRAADFAHILSGRKRPIKSLLLDQSLIGGLGNIYADESLHRARIAPDRPAGSLSNQEVEALHGAMRDVLSEGLLYKGTSFRDYVDGDGRKGSFQERLKVYAREGKPCVECESPIMRVKLAGRSSYFCPDCQR